MTDHHCADTPLVHLKFHQSEISDRIRGMVRAGDRDNAAIGVLSTREQYAVALVLDRPDLAKGVYCSPLAARKHRARWSRMAAALNVQCNGWAEPAELDFA